MSRRRLTTSPTSTPTRRSRKRPIVEPISAPGIEPDRIVFSLYELIGFNEHRKCHPNYYGDCLGEFLTPAEAKRWLRDHQRYGAFAIVERVNGKIGRAWPYEIDPPEGDTDYDPSGDPRIEVARLQAKLEATRNGAHNPVLEKMAERFLDEKMKDPLDQLTGTAEKYERLQTMFGARREPNPAQTPQQQTDSSAEMFKLLVPLIEHGEGPVKEMAVEMASKYLKGESSGQEILMEVLNAPQLVPAIQTFGNVLLGIVDRIFPVRQAQASGQEPQAPQAPTSQPPQQQQQVAQQAQQPLPETVQEPQAQPTQQEFVPPEQQALMLLVNHCTQNQPVKIAFDRLMAYADAVNEQAPQYSIDGYIEMLATTPTDVVIAFVKTLPGGEQVASLAHTHGWCETLQRIIRDSGFLDEDASGEFDQVTEVDQGNVKL